MNTSMSDNDNTSAGPRSRTVWSWTPAIVFGTAVIALAIHATVYAPAMWRTAELLKAEQIDQENRTFCEKFGMPHGSERFAACQASLGEIRQWHADRLAAEAAGIF